MEHPTRRTGTRETTVTTSNPMQLGMVGLGRMGENIVRRLIRDGRNCAVFDVHPRPSSRWSPARIGRPRSRPSTKSFPLRYSPVMYLRFVFRDLDAFADEALSAMRKGFGGHDEKKV